MHCSAAEAQKYISQSNNTFVLPLQLLLFNLFLVINSQPTATVQPKSLTVQRALQFSRDQMSINAPHFESKMSRHSIY